MASGSHGFRVGRWTGRRRATPVGINLALGAVIVVAAALVAGLLPADRTDARLTVVALGVAVFAAVSVDVPAVAAAVAFAALVVNGFLVDRMGELGWHGRADLARLAVLVAAGVAGFVAGAALRLGRRRRGGTGDGPVRRRASAPHPPYAGS